MTTCNNCGHKFITSQITHDPNCPKCGRSLSGSIDDIRSENIVDTVTTQLVVMEVLQSDRSQHQDTGSDRGSSSNLDSGSSSISDSSSSSISDSSSSSSFDSGSF